MKTCNLKKRFITLFIFVGFYSLCFGQSTPSWNKFEWLLGEWVGEGTGQPGQGNGTFNFKNDLDKKILVRKSHSQYPKTENKPEIIHDDLMVVYSDFSEGPLKAIYFDNEGHAINYSVQCTDKSIVFTSSKLPNAPVFRLTYTLLDNQMVDTKFEISRDGEIFSIYVEGKSRKVK